MAFPLVKSSDWRRKGLPLPVGALGFLGDPEPAPAVLELEEILPDCPSAFVFSIFHFLCVSGASGRAGEDTQEAAMLF